MNTLDDFKKELDPFKNTLVLDHFKVVLLIDVIDGGDDYYWVYDTFKGIVHATCVGGWVPLKGFIQEKEYTRLVNIWNLNHSTKVI